MPTHNEQNHNDKPLGNRFNEALQYAFEAHSDQTRKGTNIPYISHLLGVASIVIEHGGSEDEAIAALLHDTVEDAGGRERLKDVKEKFGSEVARIVENCSDTDTISKPPWRQRKEAYIEHLKYADESTIIVSAADKLHNARAILRDYREIGDRLWLRFNATKEEELWYYRTLAEVFTVQSSARVRSIVFELKQVVKEIERLATG